MRSSKKEESISVNELQELDKKQNDNNITSTNLQTLEYIKTANNNVGVSDIPDELFEKIINSLPLQTIRNLRASCRFFAFNGILKSKIESLSIVTGCYWTVILRNERAYLLGRYSYGGQAINIPKLIPINNPVIKIVAGDAHVLLLDKDSNCFGFGVNEYGQLGGTGSISEDNPKQIELPDKMKIIDISAGTDNTFLKSENGNWYGLGHNTSKESGVFTVNRHVYEPTLIQSLIKKSIIKIHSKGRVTFAQDDQGQWYGCGNVYSSIISDLSKKNGAKFVVTTPNFFPINLPDGKNIVDIKCQFCLSEFPDVFILNSDNEWLCLGRSDLLLSLNPKQSLTDPTPLPALIKDGYIVDIIPCDNKIAFCDNKKQWYLFEGDRNIFNLEPENKSQNVFNHVNNNPITQFVPSVSHTLLCDDKRNWYGLGDNQYNELGLGFTIKKVSTLTKINFNFEDPKCEEKIKMKFG